MFNKDDDWRKKEYDKEDMTIDLRSMARAEAVMPAFLIALSIFASSWLATSAFTQSKAREQSLSSTGSAERIITSDTAKWTVSFSRTSDVNGLKQASADLQRDLEVIKGELARRSLAEASLTIQPSTVTAICDAGTGTWDSRGQAVCGAGKMNGYALAQILIIESHDVDAVQKATQELPGILTNRGIVFTSVALEYYYSKLADLKMELLAEATKNAMNRAKVIAESAGAKLGVIQDAGAGVFQVTSVNSTDVSDYGMYDTTTVQKKVASVVRATFHLEP